MLQTRLASVDKDYDEYHDVNENIFQRLIGDKLNAQCIIFFFAHKSRPKRWKQKMQFCCGHHCLTSKLADENLFNVTQMRFFSLYF